MVSSTHLDDGRLSLLPATFATDLTLDPPHTTLQGSSYSYSCVLSFSSWHFVRSSPFLSTARSISTCVVYHL